MRHRVERMKCPCCKNHSILKPICTACHGVGEVIMLHMPNGHEVEIHSVLDEQKLRERYPDAPTPVHERTSITKAWVSFMKMVEIQHASPEQKREMKRAFFAGAHWMLEMCSIQMDPASTPTADDLENLQRISAEIMTFVEKVEHGGS